jgi:hypothetical protein
MARYRSTRRNGYGVRRTGALIINGSRRRRSRRSRRNGRARRSAPRVMYLRHRARTNGRRRSRRNGRRRTSYAMARANGRRRRSRRGTRRSYRAKYRFAGRRRTRRNGWRRAGQLRIRTNGRRRRSRRNGNGAGAGTYQLPFTSSIKRMIGRVPLVGKPLAGAVALGGTALLGAVSVLPTTLLAQTVGPMVPNMNSSLFYAFAGLALAGVIGSTKFLGASFHRHLAIATAAAGGAVALYKWQTGDDGPMAAETGRLVVRGPMAGIGTLLVGNRVLGGYGPSAVRPMATYGGYY